MATGNSVDYHAIRNTIASYCIAIDKKDYSALSQVFAEDADAVYPFGHGTQKGVSAIGEMIRKRNQHCTTQHALTTQAIEIADNGTIAKATTYFSAMHFGQGEWKGKVYTVWGHYVDHLVRVHTQPQLPGASGQWRIQKREVDFVGADGDRGLKKEESG